MLYSTEWYYCRENDVEIDAVFICSVWNVSTERFHISISDTIDRVEMQPFAKINKRWYILDKQTRYVQKE